MELSTTSLPCPSCSEPINLSSVEWCHCVSRALSVICQSCGKCFCKVSLFPMRNEWNIALRTLIECQTEEKFRRAIKTSAAKAEGGLTVLIVDDDEEIRLIAEYSVQQMGYRTFTAANAEEALQQVEQCRPDIVLTDALMPKVDGRQLCRMIKTLDPAIKVVIMSSLYTSPRYRTEAVHTFHADDYLVKPINFDELKKVLERVSRKAA